MAETTRTRIIANPGKRRARRRNGPRHMSAKQIAIFGSKAQKAALRGARKRKRNAGARKHSLHRRHARRTAVKRNAGEIVGFTLANRGRKSAKKGKATMAKTRRARRRNAGSGTKIHRRRRTRRNVGVTHHRRRSVMHHRRTRRNPGMGGLGPLVTTSAFALVGAAASKILPQVLLGANNTGWMGYAANAGAGFLLWMLAEKVLRNRNAATGIAIGTAVQIMDRIINDMTPFGAYLSGAGFGDYQAQAFVTPQRLQDPYNRAEIQIPGAWRPAPLPPPASPSRAAAAVGVSGYGGGSLYGGHSSLY